MYDRAMPPAAISSDPYRRRREAGQASREQTRRALLAAADALFRQHGYTNTTVAAIAERAGVSLQTLYLAWGSKTALFLFTAAAAAAAVAEGLPLPAQDWHAEIDTQLAHHTGAEPSTSDYLQAVAQLFVQVAERSAPYWRMYHEAAADTDLAANWDATNTRRRETLISVARHLPRGDLRTDLTEQDITETLWALTHPDVYDLLCRQGGHRPEWFAAWLHHMLADALTTVRPTRPAEGLPGG